MPDYTVAMTCFLNHEERLDYLNRTLEALWIKITPKPSRILISAEADGVSPGLREALRLMAEHRIITEEATTTAEAPITR